MVSKQRFYFGVTLSLAIAVLSYWFKDKLPIAYFYFSITLICLIALYLISYYTFQMPSIKYCWTRRIDRIIAFFVSIGILRFGINMANKIDDEKPSFWVNEGNIWLKDVLGVIIALIIGYAIFSWFFKQWKNIQTLKNEKSIAELALLKNQINPHFFFNTLNNLYALIKKDADAAQDYVLKLSDLMRFTIYDSGKESVQLKDEIDYLLNFIDLQTARYHKDIDVFFVKTIKNSDAKVAPLLFIILLENAFKHGVENAIDNAFIHVELIEEDEKISFTVKNNFHTDISSEMKGIGLKNLKDRLNILYPSTHLLTNNMEEDIYSATLEIRKK